MAATPSPEAASPSPVPLPDAPVVTTPGPRAARLDRLYREAIAHTLERCNYANFAQCFPTPATHVPEALKDLHRDFLDRFGQRCHEEFKLIVQERNLVPALNDLDRLVDEARERRKLAQAQAAQDGGPVQTPVPPHMMPTSKLYYSRLNNHLRAREAELQAKLEQLRIENHQLAATESQQRSAVSSILRDLQTVVGDIDASLETLGHDDMAGLTTEAVMDDAAISATL